MDEIPEDVEADKDTEDFALMEHSSAEMNSGKRENEISLLKTENTELRNKIETLNKEMKIRREIEEKIKHLEKTCYTLTENMNEIMCSDVSEAEKKDESLKIALEEIAKSEKDKMKREMQDLNAEVLKICDPFELTSNKPLVGYNSPNTLFLSSRLWNDLFLQ